MIVGGHSARPGGALVVLNQLLAKLADLIGKLAEPCMDFLFSAVFFHRKCHDLLQTTPSWRVTIHMSIINA